MIVAIQKQPIGRETHRGVSTATLECGEFVIHVASGGGITISMPDAPGSPEVSFSADELRAIIRNQSNPV